MEKLFKNMDEIIFHSKNEDKKGYFDRYCEKQNKVIIYLNGEMKIVNIDDISLNKMCGFKTYRHNNPKEKELHDKFIEEFIDDKFSCDLSLLVFPATDGSGFNPSDHLSDREKRIFISAIQWIGTPVGQNFLRKCGFKIEK
jgi:hypothetical protein